MLSRRCRIHGEEPALSEKTAPSLSPAERNKKVHYYNLRKAEPDHKQISLDTVKSRDLMRVKLNANARLFHTCPTNIAIAIAF